MSVFFPKRPVDKFFFFSTLNGWQKKFLHTETGRLFGLTKALNAVHPISESIPMQGRCMAG